MKPATYWLVSLPTPGAPLPGVTSSAGGTAPATARGRERMWEKLQERTSASSGARGLSSNHKLEVPGDLRVGTLDSLLTLSDDLVRVNASVESVVAKLRRTASEVLGSGGSGSSGAHHSSNAANILKVENLPAEAYLCRFKWDEAKFPTRRPLKETVEKITTLVAHIEDDLKVRMGEYNSLKAQLSALSRKTGGSLAVRDIANIVKSEQLVETENLTTLFVVVTKYNLKEWKSTYETICSFVVPRSSNLVAEDNDYALVTVVLFKRVIDDFKAGARVRGYQIRELAPQSMTSNANSEQQAGGTEALQADAENKRNALESWCKTAYSEAFSSWIHLTVIRLFVESILRYGLPPAFLAVVVKPVEKAEKKLRVALGEVFGRGVGEGYWKDDGTQTNAALAGDAESFPYVSLTVNIEL